MRIGRLLARVGVAAALAGAAALGQEGPPEKIEDRVAPVERNGPAEQLERFALRLGLSFSPERFEAPRP